MTPAQRQILVALDYLTSALPPKIANVAGEEFPIVQMTSPQGLATKLRIDLPTATALEAALQAAGMIYSDQFTGLYNTPRYNLAQGGYAYQVVARQSRPITPLAVLPLIPRGAFAGDRVSVQAALMQLVAAGYVTTSDGGATFLPA